MQIPTESKGEPHRGFPDVFHPDLTAAINEFEQQGFNREYICTALLSILSTAIGTSYNIHGLEHNRIEPAVLWTVLAGPSGTAKTALIKQMLAPVQAVNKQQIRDSLRRMEEWEQEQFQEKARQKGRKADSGSDLTPPTPRPEKRKTIFKDFTFEALSKGMENNPKGILLHSDEVLGFLANLNKYNGGKGGDLEIMMGLWSGEGISVSRLTRPDVETESSNINILGGIQPGRLKKLINKDSIESGLAHRFIFALPDAKATYPYRGTPDLNALDRYSEIITNLMHEPPDLGTLRLNTEARERLFEWVCFNRDMINRFNEEGNQLAGACAKYESHLLRFALIIQVSDDYCNGIKPEHIQLQAIDAAISLFDHYIENQRRIYTLCNLEDGLQHLKTWHIQLLRYLPPITEVFERRDAIEMKNTLRIDVADRSVDEFLKDDAVFEHQAQGKYRKRVSA